jgi:hypothetical protein
MKIPWFMDVNLNIWKIKVSFLAIFCPLATQKKNPVSDSYKGYFVKKMDQNSSKFEEKNSEIVIFKQCVPKTHKSIAGYLIFLLSNLICSKIWLIPPWDDWLPVWLHHKIEKKKPQLILYIHIENTWGPICKDGLVGSYLLCDEVELYVVIMHTFWGSVWVLHLWIFLCHKVNKGCVILGPCHLH